VRFTMKTININDSIGGITLNVHFQEKFCYLDNASGTGKSFLFRLLRRYYKEQDLVVIHVNYETETSTESTLMDYCKHADVVLLDNADLYLTRHIIQKFRELDIQVIICMKNIRQVYSSDFVLYDVIYEGNTLSVKRCG